jgi:hypothetical protein
MQAPPPHPVAYGLAKINASKILAGVAMLMLNVGSRYVDVGFSKSQETALRNNLIREILIFAMMFTATRDVVTSTLMTAAFVILSDFLLNEKSRYCIIPSMREASDKMEEVSQEEVLRALDVLKRANVIEVQDGK